MLHPPLKKMIVKDDMVFTGKNDRENKACRDNGKFFWLGRSERIRYEQFFNSIHF